VHLVGFIYETEITLLSSRNFPMDSHRRKKEKRNEDSNKEKRNLV